MNLESDLRNYIREHVLREPSAVIGEEESLISSGRIDSLGLIQLLTHVAETYRVDLMSSGVPEDFESVRSLADAIRRRSAP